MWEIDAGEFRPSVSKRRWVVEQSVTDTCRRGAKKKKEKKRGGRQRLFPKGISRIVSKLKDVLVGRVCLCPTYKLGSYFIRHGQSRQTFLLGSPRSREREMIPTTPITFENLYICS